MGQVCPSGAPLYYYLKCRVVAGVDPELLLKEFESFGINKLYFPRESGRMQVFLEFRSSTARRRAHARNDSYIADFQLQLLHSSRHGLAQSIEQGEYSVYEVARPR